MLIILNVRSKEQILLLKYIRMKWSYMKSLRPIKCIRESLIITFLFYFDVINILWIPAIASQLKSISTEKRLFYVWHCLIKLNHKPTLFQSLNGSHFSITSLYSIYTTFLYSISFLCNQLLWALNSTFLLSLLNIQ
jgi:hypothetical protein